MAIKVQPTSVPAGSGDVVDAPTALTAAQRDRAGVTATIVANGAHRAEYEDAIEWAEIFDDLTAWPQTNGGGLQVSGNAAFSVTGGNPSNKTRPVNIGDTERFKLQGVLTIPASWTPKSLLMGIAGSASSTTAFLMVGAASTGPAGFARGTGWGSALAQGPTNLTAGTYLCTMVGDETTISMNVRALTGSLAGQEWPSASVARSSLPAGHAAHIMVSNLDTAALTGASWSKIAFKRANGSLRARTKTNSGSSVITVEGNGPQIANVVSPTTGDRWRIQLPTAYDSRKPSPIVFFTHQASTGWEQSPASESRLRPVAAALAAAGFILASAQDGASYTGTQNFNGDRYGNQASMDNHLEFYRYLRDHYTTGPVLVLGASMGGNTGANLIAKSKIPNIVGMCMIDASFELLQIPVISAGAYAPYIYAAYGAQADGSDFAAKLSGWNPMARSGRDYRGVPMRFYASTQDGVVDKTLHTDPFAAKVAPYASEAVVVTQTLPHLDASHYVASEIVAFFQRCVQQA